MNVHRANNEHRALRISRGVLTNKQDTKPSTVNITASNVIFLGSTQVIAQARLQNSEQTVLTNHPLTVSINLVKDIQNQIRRELQEQKEAFYTAWTLSRLNEVLNYQTLSEAQLEVKLTLNVVADDGNLVCAIAAAIVDLL